MGVEETKHDLMLKRVQITLAILGSLIALIVGIYNFKKTVLEKPTQQEMPKMPPPPPPREDKLRSALEDVGASWIQELKKKSN